jgi:hypothetical protein
MTHEIMVGGTLLNPKRFFDYFFQYDSGCHTGGGRTEAVKRKWRSRSSAPKKVKERKGRRGIQSGTVWKPSLPEGWFSQSLVTSSATKSRVWEAQKYFSNIFTPVPIDVTGGGVERREKKGAKNEEGGKKK